MMKYLILVAAILIQTSVFAQGPWAAGKGHGYGQVLFNTIPTYNTLYIGNGNTRETERELSDITLATYLDYGITDKLTFNANVPYIFLNSGELVDNSITPITEEGSLSGLGNITLGGKYTIIQKKLVAAVHLQADLATRSFDNSTGLSTGVDATTVMPKFSIGSSDNNWFVYGYFGYGIRSNDYHDIINYGIEGGIKASENVSIILNINSVNQLDNGLSTVDTPTNLETGFYTSIQEYNAFLLKIYAEKIYGNFGGLVSLGGGSGTSVAVSPALSLGIFYKW